MTNLAANTTITKILPLFSLSLSSLLMAGGDLAYISKQARVGSRSMLLASSTKLQYIQQGMQNNQSILYRIGNSGFFKLIF
jgi:hypothetical protein